MLLSVGLLAGCVTPRAPFAPLPWEQRVALLQQAMKWQLDGRAAAAIGTQGWQADLSWSQIQATSEVHLAGPLGLGAQALRLTPAGLFVNGAPAGEEVVAQLQDRVGFQLPLTQLRYWLLGVPDPGAPFTLVRNAQDRAQRLEQAGWAVDYDLYEQTDGDWLPRNLVLTRESVRVRIVIDHWSFER
jgi:outer membrane lipoprotein LolB